MTDSGSACVHGTTAADIWKGKVLHCPSSNLSRPQGSLFGPYTPLQQIDVLAEEETKSFIAGSTNGLLLLQKDKYDVVVNVRP